VHYWTQQVRNGISEGPIQISSELAATEAASIAVNADMKLEKVNILHGLDSDHLRLLASVSKPGPEEMAIKVMA